MRWKIINEFVNRNVKHNQIEYIITENGIKLYNKDNIDFISNKFNNFFL